MKNVLEKKSKENGPVSRKRQDKTERAIAVGRRTREEKVKWNEMTALRFQTRGKHKRFPASLRGEGDCKVRRGY